MGFLLSAPWPAAAGAAGKIAGWTGRTPIVTEPAGRTVIIISMKMKIASRRHGPAPAFAVRPGQRVLACVLSLAALCTVPSVPAQPVGLPSMGAASATELSPLQERRLGDAIMVQGRMDPSYIGDADLIQYLTELGEGLAKFAPNGQIPVQIFGLKDPTINAFAMPGGYIGVHSGLIVSSESESELAGVVAHEIGHVSQRHIARGLTQQSQNSGVMMAAVAAALLAAVAGGGADLATGLAAFGQAAAIDRQLGFSRDAEREADRAGVEMLRKAGYDPNGMVHMFARLMNASRLNEGTGGGAYASTHPLSLDRMSDMQNRVRMLPPVNHASSPAFWFLRARLRVQQASDPQARQRVEAQLRDEARADTGVRRASALYGQALLALQRNDLEGAGRLLAASRADGMETPQQAALEVEIAWAGKQDARQLAAAAWKRWPEQQLMVRLNAQALQRAGDHAGAVAFLDERLKDDRPVLRDSLLYQLRAQSLEQLGRKAQARRDMARYYRETGALAAAVGQLRQARGMTSDFYEQSQIDAEINDIQRQLEDERVLLERFRAS